MRKIATKPGVGIAFGRRRKRSLYLNLPPKPAVNHKAKQVITLAYDQKSLKPTELFTGKMRLNPHKINIDLTGFSTW
jgi:hypothetical protein